MGACEDGTCYDIPPPQGIGNGPFVLTVLKDVNGGLPYWELLSNLTGGPVPAAKASKTRRKR